MRPKKELTPENRRSIMPTTSLATLTLAALLGAASGAPLQATQLNQHDDALLFKAADHSRKQGLLKSFAKPKNKRPTNAIHKKQCTDDPTYSDSGWACNVWIGWDCGEYTAGIHWSEERINTLRTSCALYAARHPQTHTHTPDSSCSRAQTNSTLSPAQSVYRWHLHDHNHRPVPIAITTAGHHNYAGYWWRRLY